MLRKKKKKIISIIKKSVGQPTVMTPEVLLLLQEAFEWGCTDIEACLHANISTSAFYIYQKENKGYLERKQELKDTPTLRARKTVVKALEDDVDIALKYLERKKKCEFSTRTETTGKDGGDIRTTTTFDLAKIKELKDLLK